MGKIKGFIKRIEESDTGMGLWICTLLCIIFIRDFVENMISFYTISRIDSFHFIHFPIFFISVLLAIIILLHLFSRTEITKVSRISLVFFMVIILPVVVDFLMSLVTKADISYCYIVENLRANFINFLNPFLKIPSIPYGVRAEIALASVLSFLYIFIKRGRLFLSLLSAFLVFCVCFFYISIPAILIELSKTLSGLFNTFINPQVLINAFTQGDIAQRRVSIIELFLAVLLVTVWFLRYDRSKLMVIVRNLRFYPSIHYAIMVIMGIAFSFAFNSAVFAEPFIFIRIIGIMSAVFFAFQFSVVTNDIYDIDCDRVSNRNRPLAINALNKNEYLKVAVVYLAFSLLFAFDVSDSCFMLILLFIVMYFIYSVPPLRLKRFFPISPIIIAAQAVIAFLAGCLSLISGEAPFFIEPSIVWLIFLVFLFSSNIKDLKDIKGDGSCGVYTLPVIFGEEQGRKIIGFLVFLSYIIVPVFLKNTFDVYFILFIVALGLGLYSYFYIIRKRAEEKVMYLIYFIYAFLIIFFIGQPKIIRIGNF